ncbi:MAG: DNA topology modulation protein [Ruminococcaceae bacterium]|nr:DNA topology modulation protein [Oscillospiraceae bacterium]
MKIAIIGYSGSGKSTLAKHLAAKHGTDVLYLDTVHWLPGWNERSREEKEKIVEDFLNTHGSWVIDGNYSKLFYDRRMEEADQIIFMAFNRFACLYRAYKRHKAYKGRSRESITEGCDEKMDLEFIKWILHGGRSKKAKARYTGVIEKFGDKVTVIKNQRQLERFYKENGLPTENVI